MCTVRNRVRLPADRRYIQVEVGYVVLCANTESIQFLQQEVFTETSGTKNILALGLALALFAVPAFAYSYKRGPVEIGFIWARASTAHALTARI